MHMFFSDGALHLHHRLDGKARIANCEKQSRSQCHRKYKQCRKNLAVSCTQDTCCSQEQCRAGSEQCGFRAPENTYSHWQRNQTSHEHAACCVGVTIHRMRVKGIRWGRVAVGRAVASGLCAKYGRHLEVPCCRTRRRRRARNRLRERDATRRRRAVPTAAPRTRAPPAPATARPPPPTPDGNPSHL